MPTLTMPRRNRDAPSTRAGGVPLRAVGRRVWIVLAVVVIVVVAIGPFFYLVSASLRDQVSLFSYPPDWLPIPPFLGNMSKVLEDTAFLRWTFNSLFVGVVVTAIKVVIDSMAAYALTKMEFAGRRVMLGALLATVMIPAGVLIVPLFFMARDLQLLDTYWALLLPPLANPIGIFMVRSSIQSLPNDLESAARIDNCNPFQVFRHVILPVIKPGLIVVAVFTFLTQYTSFVWPLVATSSSDMFTLTAGVSSLRPRGGGLQPDWGVISAASVLALVPITLIFFALQKYFVATPVAAALKE